MTNGSLYENNTFQVEVREAPLSEDVKAKGQNVYAVVNKNSGVVEFWTNQYVEAVQNAYWMDFMLSEGRWQQMMIERANGFNAHFASAEKAGATAIGSKLIPH